MTRKLFAILAIFGLVAAAQPAGANDEPLYWAKIKATNKYERSQIANLGLTIEYVGPDFVSAIGTKAEIAAAQKTGRVMVSFLDVPEKADFPKEDSLFHSYQELMTELQTIAAENKDIVSYEVIGKSLENRDIVNIRISTDLENSHAKPGIAFMGSHHAREHLSTEMPLMLIQHLVTEYRRGNPEIVELVRGREINVIPLVNPDGSEYDIASGNYRAWRKNRRGNADGTRGVDLNRNYSFKWGTGGSSTSPSSDVYMGPEPFSEPETKTVRDFVDSHENITILLSFHTFSELILYPWGHKYESIEDARDLRVHETMARTMATWNNYTPQQSSDLYIASGDTTDWSYGVHKIISFTFELDPRGGWGTGGFYPGQDKIPVVFQKNIKPCLYLISYADNPYRVLDPKNPLTGM